MVCRWQSSVTFVAKLDGVTMTIAAASAPPSAASVRARAATQMQSRPSRHDRERIGYHRSERQGGGDQVRIEFHPNPVNKRVRLENASYIYFRNGKQAMLTLWAPHGTSS